MYQEMNHKEILKVFLGRIQKMIEISVPQDIGKTLISGKCMTVYNEKDLSEITFRL